MSKKIDVAILGATGAVGQTMLKVLHERKFPVGRVHALASQRSAGQKVMFGTQELTVETVDDFDFSSVQVGLFSAGGSVSEKWAPVAAAAGCVVIDNTSHFRYDDDVPLVVPEVNPDAVEGFRQRNIIANPNCSTIQMMVALKPLHDAAGITRINVATYQAVSGTGKEAIDELAEQNAADVAGQEPAAAVYPKLIAGNVLPHIDVFQANGYTKEEMKMVWETHKIMGDPGIRVNPTCVRVPVVFGHSEAVHIETRDKLTAEQARTLLEKAPGVKVLDERRDGGYPTARTEAAGNDWTWVGRIREDISHDCGLDLWVVSDNVRKGAASNSVQIAELLLARDLI